MAQRFRLLEPPEQGQQDQYAYREKDESTLVMQNVRTHALMTFSFRALGYCLRTPIAEENQWTD